MWKVNLSSTNLSYQFNTFILLKIWRIRESLGPLKNYQDMKSKLISKWEVRAYSQCCRKERDNMVPSDYMRIFVVQMWGCWNSRNSELPNPTSTMWCFLLGNHKPRWGWWHLGLGNLINKYFGHQPSWTGRMPHHFYILGWGSSSSECQSPWDWQSLSHHHIHCLCSLGHTPACSDVTDELVMNTGPAISSNKFYYQNRVIL